MKSISPGRNKILGILFVLISLLYFLTRLFNLTILPIFFDEANYIHWAKIIADTGHHLFISLSAGKPVLLIWLMAICLKILPAEQFLLAGRLVSVFFGFFALWGTYKVGSMVINRRTGIVAATLYVLLPFSLFHDRMALYDSMLSAMLVWTTYYIFKTARTLKLKDAVLWGLCLGGALLTKASALSFEILGPLVFLVLSLWRSPLTLKRIMRLFFLIATAFAISQIVANVQIVSKGYGEYIKKSVEYTPNGGILSGFNSIFVPNLILSWQWLSSFFTAPMFFFCFFSLIYLLIKKPQVGLGFLILTIAPIFGFSFLGQIYFPRYLLFTVPFFLIPASHLLVNLFIKHKTIFLILIPVLFINQLKFDYFLLANPTKAMFPAIDKWQYVSGSPSGYGLDSVYSEIRKAASKGKTTLVIESDYYGLLLNATQVEFFNEKRVKIVRSWPNIDVSKEVNAALKTGSVYYLADFDLKTGLRSNINSNVLIPIKIEKKPLKDQVVGLFLMTN